MVIRHVVIPVTFAMALRHGVEVMLPGMLPPMPRIDPDDRVPAALLRSALEATGTSSASLARALVVDAGTISDWKNGKTPISPSRWMAIALALGLPQTWQPGDPVPPRDE